MRTLALLPLFALLLATTACGDSTGPERRSLIGLWTSTGYPDAEITLTLSEAARSVTGTGRWLSPTRAEGFRVVGTHADQSIALIFDFEDTEDLNFLGEFTSEDEFQGTLVGAGLRGETITFRRVEDD